MKSERDEPRPPFAATSSSSSSSSSFSFTVGCPRLTFQARYTPLERGNLAELDYKPSLRAKHDPWLHADPTPEDKTKEHRVSLNFEFQGYNPIVENSLKAPGYQNRYRRWNLYALAANFSSESRTQRFRIVDEIETDS